MISEITTTEVRRAGHHVSNGDRTARAAPRVDRPGAIAGFAFAALFVVGMMLVANTPEYTVSDGEYEAWFEDGANRAGQIIGVVALVLAGFCFLRLARAASDWVRRSLDPAERAFDVVLAAVFTTLVVVGAVVTGHGSVAVEVGDTPVPSADVVRSGEQIGYGVVLFAASLVAAWMIARLAIAARRTPGAPTWFVVLSAVAAVLLVFGALFIPVVALPIWSVATAVALLRSPAVTA